MQRMPLLMRRLTFALFLMVLPLGAVFCGGSARPPFEAVTATYTPSVLIVPLALTPTPTSTTGERVLEFSREGSLSAGGVSIQWGPDTAEIPLKYVDGAYSGSYAGDFHAVVSGMCSGAYTYPFAVEVSGQEDGAGMVDFTVTTTMSMAGSLSCAAAPLGNAPVTFTRTITLPAEDGASETVTVPMQTAGEITDTYILRVP